MISDIHFRDDKEIAFGGDRGHVAVISMDDSILDYNSGSHMARARNDLLIWALIKATRDVGAKLDAMAQSNGDQATAVREQTTQMQSNIDDARANAPTPESVLQLVTKEFPEVMRSIAAASGTDLGTLLGGKPAVTTRQNGGDR